MAAETGSGKTGAFCLPILQIVWETLKDLETGKGSSGSKGAVCQGKLNSEIHLLLLDFWNLIVFDFF